MYRKRMKVPKKGGGRPPKYPWLNTAANDCFFVPLGKADPRRLQAYLAGLASGWFRRKRMRFTTRRVDGGIQVWRI